MTIKTKYPLVPRVCKHHGLTDFIHEINSVGKNRYTCRKCSNAYKKTRRKERKEQAVKYKGGGCCICGYNKCLSALDFHHVDPTREKKHYSLSSIMAAITEWNKLEKELDECILVCSNCHREIHDGLHPSILEI